MPRKKRVKYNNGGALNQTIKTSVADLNLNYSPPSKTYTATGSRKGSQLGVRGRGFNVPSSVQGRTRIGGTNVEASYNFQNKQPKVKLTKPLSSTSTIEVGYGGSTKSGGQGINAMYRKSFPFGK